MRDSLIGLGWNRHRLIQQLLRKILGRCSVGLGLVPDQKLISWRISNNDRDGRLHDSTPAFSRKSAAAMAHRTISSCCSSLESPVTQGHKSRVSSFHAMQRRRTPKRQDAGPQGRRAAKKTNPQADSILLYGLLCVPAAWRLGVKMQTVVARPAGPATDSQSLPAIPTRSKRIGVDFLASRTGSVSASTSDCQQDQGSQGINQW